MCCPKPTNIFNPLVLFCMVPTVAFSQIILCDPKTYLIARFVSTHVGIISGHLCNKINHTINRAAFVCLSVCLSVCSLSPPRSFDRSSPNLVGVCRWTSELPLRGSFSKRLTARRVNGSLSLSTILYICQPHSTQLQKATLLLLHLIRLKGTFCCIDGWWVYVGGSRNCLLDG